MNTCSKSSCSLLSVVSRALALHHGCLLMPARGVQPSTPSESRSSYLLLVPAALLLLPAALSAGLDPARILFLLLMLGTGAMSLLRGQTPRTQGKRGDPPSVRPSRDAVLDDLRKAAAATPQGAKISIPDGKQRRKHVTKPSANERIEEVSTKRSGERWPLAREHLSRLSVLSTSPPLHTCDAFLSADECAALIRAASPVLVEARPSTAPIDPFVVLVPPKAAVSTPTRAAHCGSRQRGTAWPVASRMDHGRAARACSTDGGPSAAPCSTRWRR